MHKLRTLLCTSALALVPLAATPVAASQSGGGEEKEPNPLAGVVCAVDSTQEGCTAEEPGTGEEPAPEQDPS